MCDEEKRRLVQADRLLQLATVVQEEDTWFTKRVDRVPGFLSSCLNWLPPPPHPQVSVAPPAPYWFHEKRTHLLAGVGEPIRTKGQTLWYSMFTIISLRFEPSSSLSVKLVPAGVEISITSASCLKTAQ
jgi:hypothetical protein